MAFRISPMAKPTAAFVAFDVIVAAVMPWTSRISVSFLPRNWSRKGLMSVSVLPASLGPKTFSQRVKFEVRSATWAPRPASPAAKGPPPG